MIKFSHNRSVSDVEQQSFGQLIDLNGEKIKETGCERMMSSNMEIVKSIKAIQGEIQSIRGQLTAMTAIVDENHSATEENIRVIQSTLTAIQDENHSVRNQITAIKIAQTAMQSAMRTIRNDDRFVGDERLEHKTDQRKKRK